MDEDEGDRIQASRHMLHAMWDSAKRDAKPAPFYGAQCPSYPACSGGCGLGCTHEIVNRPPPHLREDLQDCPCGGWDCSAVPGGSMDGCPYRIPDPVGTGSKT